jgi:hypothetical protein
MHLQDDTLDREIPATDGGCAVENSNAHAPRHSGVCTLCNLSLLDFATQRLLVGRLLKLGQQCNEFFIERGYAVKT